MRYLMLVYTRESEIARQGCEQMQGFPPAHQAIVQEASRRGIFCGTEALKHSATATTVRLDRGKAIITDGPFAASAEQLAGYYLLDCKDLDDALEWAVRIRTACGSTECGDTEGCVEVRPIREVPAKIADSQNADLPRG